MSSLAAVMVLTVPSVRMVRETRRRATDGWQRVLRCGTQQQQRLSAAADTADAEVRAFAAGDAGLHRGWAARGGRRRSRRQRRFPVPAEHDEPYPAGLRLNVPAPAAATALCAQRRELQAPPPPYTPRPGAGCDDCTPLTERWPCRSSTVAKQHVGQPRRASPLRYGRSPASVVTESRSN